MAFKLFKRRKKSEELTRRNFLKGLAAAPVIAVLPISPQPVDAAANAPLKVESESNVTLSDREIAERFDKDFNSPYLYVKTSQDLKQGDPVMQDWNFDDPYIVKKGSTNALPTMFLGIVCADLKKGEFGFIQTVGNMPILPEKKITE